MLSATALCRPLGSAFHMLENKTKPRREKISMVEDPSLTSSLATRKSKDK